MAAVTLQVQLPAAPLLPYEQVVEVTGRAQASKQIAWLREHGWVFELDAQGNVLIGSLYAHLRLAGLNPATVNMPNFPVGFDLSATR